MSGVHVDESCKQIFDQVKLKKKHRYVTFKIDEGKIHIDKIGDRDSKYDDFLTDLKQKDGANDDCRYAIYDYEYIVESQGTEASHRNKVFLAMWCPEAAKIKKKMVYTSSFDSLKKAFNGAQKVIQANDDDEIDQETVEKMLVSSART